MEQHSSIDIKEIADQLSMDFRAFVHKQTKELLFVPNELVHVDIDEEIWEKELKELDNNFMSYWEIEKWTSREAFEIMEAFTLQITEPTLKNKLIEILNANKPFKHFRYEVDNAGDYREKWFAFRDTQQQEFIKQQLQELQL
jgi:hypothetical protein